jgi:hypothetical protein
LQENYKTLGERGDIMNTPKIQTIVEVKFSDFDLLERLQSMSGELGISLDDLVSMAVS